MLTRSLERIFNPMRYTGSIQCRYDRPQLNEYEMSPKSEDRFRCIGFTIDIKWTAIDILFIDLIFASYLHMYRTISCPGIDGNCLYGN